MGDAIILSVRVGGKKWLHCGCGALTFSERIFNKGAACFQPLSRKPEQ